MKKKGLTASKPRLSYLLSLLFIGMLAYACSSEAPNQSNPAMKKPTKVTETTKAPAESKPRIVFFGNSLTAGYGLDPEQAFTAHIQQWIDSLGYTYEVVNAGLSGETTAGGVRRIDWLLKQPMDIFVLELGGNDMLRGFTVDVTEKNLRTIIDKVRAAHPDIPIILAGMKSPPNMGEAYTKAYDAIFPRMAKELNLSFIPFFLKDVGGIADLNLPDGIHPNAEGQKIVAQNVWEVLSQLLSATGNG